ncbi:MAG TPA: hypothetical protein VGQ13_07030 [Nitrososphaera sp.]|nr:hypothetical protein [Nitrososphaera sp.]
MSSADLKCPVCSKTLQESEYPDASEQLERHISKLFREQSRKKTQEFNDKISELKATHRKDMQAAAKKYEVERKSLQRRLEDQISKNREIRERDLREAKKNYQMQLENIRSIYQGQMEEMKKNYDQMVNSNQTQLAKLQKWLHEELIDEPFRKIALIEQAKTSAEQKVANLVQQLNDKNAEVISLHEQVKGLEDKVPKEVREQIVEEESPFDPKYQATPEEPESSEQKEWLNMIKELAQQHELRDTGVEEDAEPESEEQQNSWGSKVAKKFGLF